MTATEAMARGGAVLRRCPWIGLLPLLGDLVTLALGEAGAPAAPVNLPLRLDFPPDSGQVTRRISAFIPSAFPSLGDLHMTLHPPVQPPLGQAPPLLGLALLLGLPLLQAVLQSLFFGLLAQALDEAKGHGALARAWRALPALYALMLLWELAGIFLRQPWLLPAVLLLSLLYGLLPFAIGVLDLPLLQALRTAPGLLWQHLDLWWGLAWRTALITLLFTLLSSTMAEHPWFALLTYPWLATWLVASAAALCLGLRGAAAEPDATGGPAWLPLALTVLLAVGGAAIGGGWLSSWQGYQASAKAALAPPFQGSIVYERPQPQGELALYRSGGGLGIAALRHNRFGWQLLSSEGPGVAAAGGPVTVAVTWKPDGGGAVYGSQLLVYGEIVDSRVAYLEVEGERYRVGTDGPYIILPLRQTSLQGQSIRALDADGHPIPDRGVPQP